MSPLDEAIDKEHISESERYMFRKLGLKMKAYLLIGELSLMWIGAPSGGRRYEFNA